PDVGALPDPGGQDPGRAKRLLLRASRDPSAKGLAVCGRVQAEEIRRAIAKAAVIAGPLNTRSCLACGCGKKCGRHSNGAHADTPRLESGHGHFSCFGGCNIKTVQAL